MGKKSGLLRPHHNTLSAMWRLMDALLVVMAHYIACRWYPEEWNQQHTIVAGAGVIAFTFAAEASGLYRTWRGAPMKSELLRVWTTWAMVVPALLFLAFVTKTSQQHSRQISLAWFLIAPTLLSAWRVVARLGLQEFRKRGFNTRTVAIVGATDLGTLLAQKITSEPWNGMRIDGFYDDRHPARLTAVPQEHGGVHGNLNELVRKARNGQVDLIYIAFPMKAEPRINEVLRQLADTTASVYVAADFFVFDLLRAEWSSIGGVPVVSVFESPFSGVNAFMKRIEDVVVGTMILGLISLPMLIIAAAVKATSRGPVLFRQRRYGLNGEQIEVLKFRTMTVCEDGDVVRQATANDSRITRLGAFMRRTSLDELPQFLHVITGKMSIVGPRPHAVAHNELYRTKIHGYMLRHKVKPGITGWAQVNGWRGETDTLEKMEKRIEHDLDYIRGWSLIWDIKIIFLTVFGSAVRRNAY